MVDARAVSLSIFLPSQSSPQLQRRYSLSVEGKSLCATVTSYKFVTTEKDELRTRRHARQSDTSHGNAPKSSEVRAGLYVVQQCNYVSPSSQLRSAPEVFQKRFVKNALIGITNIIPRLRMIADDHALPEYQPVICDRSFWIFTTKEELLNVIPDVNTWVRKGEVIATIHSIFGQLIERYEAPEDSIVIGKETDPVASSGARIVHIGVLTGTFAPGKVDDGHL